MIVRRLGPLALWLTALGVVPACGTDASGVDACRQVEEALCRQASKCGIPLQPPYSTSGTDVDACIRFYDDACLHGLEVSPPPGASALNACVQAIQTNCSVVTTPQSDPACQWLVPPQPAPASDASDAPSTTGDAGDAE